MINQDRRADINVLVIEDCADDAELMMLSLSDAGYRVTWSRADTERDYLAALNKPPDVILADYTVPSFNVPHALDRLAQSGLSIPFIVVSGTISEEVAVDCLKRGAADYLVKDRLARLPQAVALALEQRRMREIQQRAEAAARQSEARFRLAFDNAPIGMAITTTDGHFLEVNDSICVLVGRSRAELMDQTLASVTHPEDRQAPLAYLASRLDGTATGFDTEMRFLRADGQVRWSRVSIAVLDQLEGEATRLIVQAQDIADRRRAEDWLRRTANQMAKANEALRDSEQRFRSLAASAPVGVFQADGAGGCTYTNDRWQEITGQTFDEALGDGWSATIHPDDRVGVVSAWESALAGLEEYIGRFRVIHPGGAQRWVDFRSVALLDATGEVSGFVGTATDITPMVDAEALIGVARDQAIEASRLKSQFLANMSHEIRTPMNGVLGMAHLLFETDLDATQQRYLRLLRDSGENLLTIINEILDFSKIEAGKLDLENIDFDLGEAVNGVANLLSSPARDKGLALRLDVATDVPTFVSGDPLRLRQVLTNLVGNAIKFTNIGTITVAVAGIGDGRARFSVADTGIGIDPSARAGLLDPFSQADSSTTRRYGGTGLGLAICAQLVELMGGSLQFESRLGRGSTFWFDIPLAPARAVRPIQTTEPAGVVSLDVTNPGARILLADDAEINQIVGVAMLERLGFRVDVVANGADALAAVERTRYDAVLMDCLMPVMDGYEATTRVRRLAGAAGHTPIIATTASAMVGDREKCLAAGMDDYISKPLDPAALAGAIARSRSRQYQARPESQLATNVAMRVGDGDGIDVETVRGLRHLERSIGSVAFAEVCATFLRHCPTQVGELNEAVAAGDLTTIHRLAHKLKGSMATMGAVRLSQLAAHLERSNRDAGELGVLVAEFDSEFARVQHILSRSAAST